MRKMATNKEGRLWTTPRRRLVGDKRISKVRGMTITIAIKNFFISSSTVTNYPMSCISLNTRQGGNLKLAGKRGNKEKEEMGGEEVGAPKRVAYTYRC